MTLAATKDDGSATYTPGGTATYTVTVSNTGVSDALDVTVADPFPAGMTLSAQRDVRRQRHVELRHGDRHDAARRASGRPARASTRARRNSLEFTVPVAFAPGMSANPLVNTATVTDVASGNTTTASRQRHAGAQVTLAVTKDDGTATYTPGGTRPTRSRSRTRVFPTRSM